MKLCNKCDPRATCCDFCKHFEFNANAKGEYTDDGFCKLHKKSADPMELCDDFHCEHVKENKKKSRAKK